MTAAVFKKNLISLVFFLIVYFCSRCFSAKLLLSVLSNVNFFAPCRICLDDYDVRFRRKLSSSFLFVFAFIFAHYQRRIFAYKF